MNLIKSIWQIIKTIWPESLFILVVVGLVSRICSVLVNHNVISGNLYDSLVGGIIAAGIIGFIVSVLMFLMQQRTDSFQQKKSAERFYRARLLPAVRELFSRNPSPWNLDGGKNFYFDNSWVNPIFDLYDTFAEEISDYQEVFKDNELINTVASIYRNARVGYVLGEKIDQFLAEFVRKQVSALGERDGMDKYVIRYLKACLFTSEGEPWALAHAGVYLDHRFRNIYAVLVKDPRIITLQNNIKDARKDLEEEVLKLKHLRVKLG